MKLFYFILFCSCTLSMIDHESYAAGIGKKDLFCVRAVLGDPSSTDVSQLISNSPIKDLKRHLRKKQKQNLIIRNISELTPIVRALIDRIFKEPYSEDMLEVSKLVLSQALVIYNQRTFDPNPKYLNESLYNSLIDQNNFFALTRRVAEISDSDSSNLTEAEGVEYVRLFYVYLPEHTKKAVDSSLRDLSKKVLKNERLHASLNEWVEWVDQLSAERASPDIRIVPVPSVYDLEIGRFGKELEEKLR